MGSWLNVAFMQSDDRARLEHEVRQLIEGTGRRIVTPTTRVPVLRDPMQYGRGDQVARWGVAAFAGAPGWTVLRTAPFELLHEGEPPLLIHLAQRMQATTFQYNVYDGSSHLLLEALADGRYEKSGFDGSNPARHWKGFPPDDRVQLRFHLVDVAHAAELSKRLAPKARVGAMIHSYKRPEHKDFPPERVAKLEPMWLEMEERFAARERDLRAWLSAVGGELNEDAGALWWSAHPADVVRALRGNADELFDIESVLVDAITTVFGGANHELCLNDFLVHVLLPHAPMPVDGWVLYAER